MENLINYKNWSISISEEHHFWTNFLFNKFIINPPKPC